MPYLAARGEWRGYPRQHALQTAATVHGVAEPPGSRPFLALPCGVFSDQIPAHTILPRSIEDQHVVVVGQQAGLDVEVLAVRPHAGT